MSINLLPSEQRGKYQKGKPGRPTYHIEMTGPGTLERSQTGIKRGGVLTFFKQVFERPQKREAELTPVGKPATKNEKPVLREKIITLHVQPPVPTVVYVKPAQEIELKPRPAPPRPRSGIFGSLFSRPAPTPRPAAPVVSPVAPQGQFPKYHGVKAESIAADSRQSERRPTVITVATKPAEQKPATSRPSAWARLVAWFQRLFQPKAKTQPVPAPTPQPAPVPQPPVREHIAVIEQQKIVQPAPAPPVVTPKPVAPVHFTPLTSRPPERIELKVTPPVLPPPKPPVPAPLPPHPVALPPVAPKLPPPPPLPQPVTPVLPVQPLPLKQKRNGFGSWLQNLWRRFRGLFSRSRRESVPHLNLPHLHMEAGASGDVSPAPTPPKVAAPVPPASRPTAPPPVTPKLAALPAPKKVIEYTHVSTSLPPPPPVPVAPHLPPPPRPATPPPHEPAVPLPTKAVPGILGGGSGIKLTEPRGFGSQAPAFNWEVNLIPEEALERKLPLTKVIALVMSVVFSLVVVFGGYVWATVSYNDVSVEAQGVDDEIQTLTAEIKRYDRVVEEATVLRLRIDTAQKLLTQHVYWQEVFAKLETYTVPEVYYVSMSADASGLITVSAVGKTYTDAVKQLYVFDRARDFVSSAEVSGITYDPTLGSTAAAVTTLTPDTVPSAVLADVPVKFNITLTVLPAVFYHPR
ncbi:MAG: hypothetical protein V1916_01800 [Patescibacteria group bacterium]